MRPRAGGVNALSVVPGVDEDFGLYQQRRGPQFIAFGGIPLQLISILSPWCMPFPDSALV